jgi:hypothetical protein
MSRDCGTSAYGELVGSIVAKAVLALGEEKGVC